MRNGTSIKNIPFLAIINILSVASLWAISYLFRWGKIAPQSIGDVSFMYFTRFTPAPFAFILWPIIYLSFSILAIWSALPSQWTNVYVQEKLGWYFSVKIIGLQIWLYLWCNHQLWTSVFVIIFEWTMANIIYQRLSIHYGNQGRSRLIPMKLGSTRLRTITTSEFWILQVPFSLFFGWGTVVSIANILAGVIKEEMRNAHYSEAQSLFRTEEWSKEVLILQSITTLGALIVLFTRFDFLVAFSVAWGWIGIAVQQYDDTLVFISSSLYASILVVSGIYCLYYINDQKKYLHLEKQWLKGGELL